MTEFNRQIPPYPLGAHIEGDRIRFSFVSAKDNCGVILYDKQSGEVCKRIPFAKENKVGNVHCAYVDGYAPESILYQFYEEEMPVTDERATLYANCGKYGEKRSADSMKAGFAVKHFDWQEDSSPRIPYEESLVYLLHVRGFTKHVSSKVKNKGTFSGILEKLDYLKDIGVTCVELQPAYEFIELADMEESKQASPYALMTEPKLNYWGYCKGFYYAPKASYGVKNASLEFKELVREMHKKGMELVMQFYFPEEISVFEIPEILRYWVMEYHVDGFHLMGGNLPADLLAADSVLAGVKIWYYYFDKKADCSMPGIYQDDYMYTMRKFLKGDEDMVKSVMYEMRRIPQDAGRIHYMSNYYGMTLMDMVSYDRKHNEDNGEENRDGNDYNCSWNCGEEGPSRKKKLVSLRTQQIKNAICMLLLSQSTPLIFMGDEFGNSQKGNNNPYCQDNAIAWLDWKDKERNKDIYEFWKEMVALRRKHPVLHRSYEPRIMDYIACGYPDLSYHGMNAWRPQTENYSRCIGMMYCGKYAKIDRVKDDDSLYIAMNMHWENHEFGLPRLPKGMKWQLLLSTEGQKVSEKAVDEAVSAEILCEVLARTISIYISVQDVEKNE